MSKSLTFQLADHLIVHCKRKGVSFTHHGIYNGKGEVIHYSLEDGVVCVPIADFSAGCNPEIMPYSSCDLAEKVLERARSRIGG